MWINIVFSPCYKKKNTKSENTSILSKAPTAAIMLHLDIINYTVVVWTWLMKQTTIKCMLVLMWLLTIFTWYMLIPPFALQCTSWCHIGARVNT